jgi:uncharacterized protein YfaS (alpha-2-macroglobulin family)
VEQTASSTRPLLYVDRFVDEVDPKLVASGGIAARVEHGLDRLLSMQTPSGGFGYWPGATNPSEWSSANVAHILLDAKKAGYDVPPDALEDAMGYLEGLAKSQSTAGSAAPYTHYVLAVGGRPLKAQAQKVLEGLPSNSDKGWDQEREYLVKAALYLAGDRRYEADLRTLSTGPIGDRRLNDWSFYSDLRWRAFQYNIFVDLFGDDDGGDRSAFLLAERLRSRDRSGSFTTQELTWSITALGKRVSSMKAANFEPPVLTWAGGTLEPNNPDPKDPDRSWPLTYASLHEGLSLSIPKKGAGSLWVFLNTEGVRQGETVPLGGDGLRVSRSYHALDGRALDMSSGPELGDLVVVKLSLQNVAGGHLQNVALVDRLPAGFEIENPRLGRDTSIEWVDPSLQWAMDFMDIRDDRIELFGHLESNETVEVVYAVRAVTAGEFTIPPVEAEAMYDPRIWAREGALRVAVRGPWEPFLAAE